MKIDKNKIADSIREGTFLAKFRQKIKNFFFDMQKIFIVNDSKVKELQRQILTSKKIKKEFKTLIDNHKMIEKRKLSNKVWICWFQGLVNAPELVKACINSAKTVMPNRDIIILTDKNISKYIELPKYVNEKRKKGIISLAHYSDLLRICLLCKYGGIWIDATVFCTASAEDFKAVQNSPLFAYKKVNLLPRTTQPIEASSWLIAANSNSPILCLTRDILLSYWKKYNYLMNYYLFHIIFSIACEKYPDEWKSVPNFNNVSPHILGKELSDTYRENRWKQYLSMSSFHKLDHHIKYKKNNKSNYAYILKLFKNDER